MAPVTWTRQAAASCAPRFAPGKRQPHGNAVEYTRVQLAPVHTAALLASPRVASESVSHAAEELQMPSAAVADCAFLVGFWLPSLPLLCSSFCSPLSFPFLFRTLRIETSVVCAASRVQMGLHSLADAAIGGSPLAPRRPSSPLAAATAQPPTDAATPLPQRPAPPACSDLPVASCRRPRSRGVLTRHPASSVLCYSLSRCHVCRVSIGSAAGLHAASCLSRSFCEYRPKLLWHLRETA